MASSCRETVIDALHAMDLVSRRAASEAEGEDLLVLLRAAGQMIRWRRETALGATMGAVGEVVTMHPWAFADDIESGVLTGLRHLIAETDVGMKNSVGIHRSAGVEDVSRKLLLRQAAAKLSYRLFKHYRTVGDEIPEQIAAWEAVCESDVEFLEIRKGLFKEEFNAAVVGCARNAWESESRRSPSPPHFLLTLVVFRRTIVHVGDVNRSCNSEVGQEQAGTSEHPSASDDEADHGVWIWTFNGQHDPRTTAPAHR